MYDLSKVCRTCLSVENVVKSIFSSNTDSTLLFCDMLMAVSNVKIKYNDGLPSQICLKCINKIMLAYSFKRECEKSEKILLNYVSETSNQIEILDCSDGESGQNIVKNEVKYMCHKCNKYFATSSSLKKHVRTKHTNNTEKKIPEKNSLVKCDWCEYVFVSEFTLKKHISSKHKNKKLKSFQTDEQKLVNIIPDNNETKTTAKCSFCNYVFANEDHLKKHLFAKHLNNEYDSTQTDMQGFCYLCGIQSKNIQLHINEHYKHLYCTNCSLKFENVDNFEEHVKQNLCNKRSSYLCSICGKIFNQLSNFQIHSLVHGKQNLYSCTICDRSFTTPSILNLHVKTHTHEHPYVCEMCGQSFKQVSELTIHKRIHSNERPLQCNICCKRFNTVDKLNCHKRIHTYSCKICNKTFGILGTLRKHSFTHMREKKQICKLCGKQFSQTSTLLKHLKSHE